MDYRSGFRVFLALYFCWACRNKQVENMDQPSGGMKKVLHQGGRSIWMFPKIGVPKMDGL